MIEIVGIGVVVFASAHIDDLFVIAAFFADRKLKRIWVVSGQVAGTAVLVTVSAVAAQLAVDMDGKWVALVGFVPLLLGALLAIVVGAEAFRARRRSNQRDDVRAEAAALPDGSQSLRTSAAARWMTADAAFLLVALVLYVAAMAWIGFAASTALFSLAVMCRLGTKWWLAALGSAVIVGAIHLLFVVLFKVQLP